MNKRLALLAVLPAAAALALAPALAAFAVAPLPETDDMFSAGYNEGDGDEMGSSDFWRVVPGSPSTVETISTGHVDPESVTDGAYSALTGVSYLVGWGYGPECELWSVDTVTGAYTFIAPITQSHELDEETPEPSELCHAFEVLDSGIAYVTIFDDQLYTLDLATGVATFVADISDGEDGFNPSTISTDVSTGTSYAISWDGDYVTIDLATGLVTAGGSYPEFEGTYDSDFDSAGTLWVTTWQDADSNLVSIADPAIPALNEVDPTIAGWRTDSIWIVPAVEPTLAATGTDITPFVLGAAALLALGGAFVLRRRTAQD